MPGYQTKFVDKVRKRHQCPLCHLPMRDPVQITACRHRYCDTCLQDYLGEGVFSCPVDHLSLDYAKIYPDPDLETDIMSLTTHCSNYPTGCKWTGKLHNLKAHLDKCTHSERDCPNRCGVRLRAMNLADHLEFECLKRRVTCDFCAKDFTGEQMEEHDGSCPMETVHCENKCGAKMLRKYLNRHSTGDCPKRPTKCTHCSKDFSYDILQTHHGNCPRYPVGCPNRCDVLKIPREELEMHLKEQCKSALTPCPFKEAGCKHRCPRYHLDRHLTEANATHIKSMFELVKTQKQQILELQKQVNDLSIHQNGTLLWRINDYSKKLKAAQSDQIIECKSPPFYTHRYGYKLQLSAFLNGNGSGLNSHMSLYIRVLAGDYDSLLEWPFSHDITFNILDQGDPLSSKRSHISVRFTPDPTWKNFQQPSLDSANDSTLGFGYPKFVSHKELKDNNYLKGNALFIKATVDTSRIVIP
ncbi:TNF receptor-associated factor 4-like [Clavelina lepadiformis]|uniref:TNF receptor-associated factor 4-like n=1 Tax=Clavelina lepadiformis TaxID=159417 RepID=UPI00404105B2